MSVHESNATVYWLTCDVRGCAVTSEATCHSRGRALNLAGGDEGWHLFGPARHVCPTRDHPHEEAARRWYADLKGLEDDCPF